MAQVGTVRCHRCGRNIVTERGPTLRGSIQIGFKCTEVQIRGLRPLRCLAAWEVALRRAAPSRQPTVTSELAYYGLVALVQLSADLSH
jgi:hypothetical protein